MPESRAFVDYVTWMNISFRLFLVTILTLKVQSADDIDISYIWQYITFVGVSLKFKFKKLMEEIFTCILSTLREVCNIHFIIP